jgi:hypothetical protein
MPDLLPFEGRERYAVNGHPAHMAVPGLTVFSADSSPVILEAHLKQLDPDGKAHGQIDVRPWHMLVNALQKKRDADRHQKRKCRNFQGWSCQDELPDDVGKQENAAIAHGALLSKI